jgi:acyl-CoA synthetase (AMP-forming)/AMP-acid ligase II
VSTLPAIPSIIHQLVHSPQFVKTDLSSIVSIGSGAAYLPPKLGEKLRRLVSANVVLSEGQSQHDTRHHSCPAMLTTEFVSVGYGMSEAVSISRETEVVPIATSRISLRRRYRS